MGIWTRLDEHLAAHDTPVGSCVFCDGAEDEPRDQNGQWTSGGGGAGSAYESTKTAYWEARAAREKAFVARLGHDYTAADRERFMTLEKAHLAATREKLKTLNGGKLRRGDQKRVLE